VDADCLNFFVWIEVVKNNSEGKIRITMSYGGEAAEIYVRGERHRGGRCCRKEFLVFAVCQKSNLPRTGGFDRSGRGNLDLAISRKKAAGEFGQLS